MVGWKETREARGAVRDTLTLLKGAKDVTIVAVEEPNQSVADSGPLDDVAAYLTRHCVSISGAITRRFAGSVGVALAAIAGEKDADLIVAGGYGHSPLSEWIWGGVTRELLGSSPVCCVLSH